MNKRNVTKSEVSLDVWAACALNEFDRLKLRAPTAKEVRDAYEVGESPATWAAYISPRMLECS